MAAEESKYSWTRGTLVAASLIVVVAGLRAASAIVVPLLLALFVSVVITPLFYACRRRGIPAGVTILGMTLALVLVSLVGASVLNQSLRQFTDELPKYQKQLDIQAEKFRTWLDEHGFEAQEKFVFTTINSRTLIRAAGNMAGTLTSLLGNTFLVLLVVIFFLLEASIMPAKVRAWPGMTDETWKRLCKIVEDIRRYMALKTMTSAATGLLIGGWVSLMGVGYAVLLGLLAFVLNYVPSIGSIIAAIPGVMLALVLQGPGTAGLVALGYLVVNVTIGNFLEPRIMGKGLGLSPLVILISLIFWGWVLGPVGMLLSVPLTMAVKIALESGADTQGIALLMGDKPGKGVKGRRVVKDGAAEV